MLFGGHKLGPSVYIETSVIGYLTSWPRDDVTVAGHQNTTKPWWATAPDRFDLFISQLVVRECSDGESTAVKDRLDSINGLPMLSITPEAESLAGALIQARAVPVSQPNDALHSALAAVHRVQYLVSCELPAHRERIASTDYRTCLPRWRVPSPDHLHTRGTVGGER